MLRHIRCTLTIALAVASAAHAQTVWIGRPTIGDVIRYQAGEALKAQQQAARSKAQFNAEIAKARADFFAAAGDEKARRVPEKRFADLLMAKDYMAMSLLVAEGTGTQARKRNDALHLITGGEIDGGIAPPARLAFNDWVNAVRKSLGARSPDDLLIVTNADSLQKALDANTADYASYKALRDRFEIDRWTSGKAVAKARTGDGKVALHHSDEGVFTATEDTMHWQLGRNQPLRALLHPLWKTQPVLRCFYGPTGTDAFGRPSYDVYRFWRGKAPDSIDRILAADGDAALGRIRTRTALDKCPANGAAAEVAFGGAARTAVAAPVSATAARGTARP